MEMLTQVSLQFAFQHMNGTYLMKHSKDEKAVCQAREEVLSSSASKIASALWAL